MRYFFRSRVPPITRMLVVESGGRFILEAAIPRFRAVFGDEFPIDILTCLAGLPQVLDPATTDAFRVTDCGSGRERWRLLRKLRSRRYPVLAMVCSDEPVMTLWKVAAAALVPAKVVIFNENSDFFVLDWRHRKQIRRFVLFRAGLLEDDAVPKLAHIAVFPILFAYLLLYAGYVHLRRAFRLMLWGGLLGRAGLQPGQGDQSRKGRG